MIALITHLSSLEQRRDPRLLQTSESLQGEIEHRSEFPPGLQLLLVGRGAAFPGQGAASSWESREQAKCSWMDWASHNTQTLPERGLKGPVAP